MSQPPYPYNRIFDFESFSIVNPTTQQPGVQIEGELDNVKRTLDSVISRLSEIQRDDGYIRDSALDQSTVIPQFYSRLSLLFAPSFALKANINSPTFTGVVTIPANAVIVGFAKLDSPNLTGVPTAPTPATLNSSQQIANSSFVTAADAVIKQFAINADAVIKQFVIDNYLKLDGDQMHDDSIIFWTKDTPSQWASQALGTEKDNTTSRISRAGVSVSDTKFLLSSDGDTGPTFDPLNPPHAGEFEENEASYTKRETKINAGSIEVFESLKSDLGNVNSQFELKGKITLWSGESIDGLTFASQSDPASFAHIKIANNGFFGPAGLTMSAFGIEFADQTFQDTRGLSLVEVQMEAQAAADFAVSNLIDGAPAVLDTLKEIADALANDADLAGTLTAAIALKADDNAVLKLAGGSMTDDAAIDIKSATGNTDSEVGAWGFGVEQTDTPTTGATLEKTGLHVYSAGSNMNVSAVGITFPNGSVQSSAATSFDPTGYATESFVNQKGYTTLQEVRNNNFAKLDDWQINAITASSYRDLSIAASSGSLSATYYDGWLGQDVQVYYSIESPVNGTDYDGYQVQFNDSHPMGSFFYNGNSVTIGLSGYANMQEACNALAYGGASGGWKLLLSGSPYVQANILQGFGGTVYSVNSNAQGKSLVIKEGMVPMLSSAVKSYFPGQNVGQGLYATDGNGNLTILSQNYFPTNVNYLFEMGRRVLKSGDTFTGKVSLATISVNNPSLNIGGQCDGNPINAVNGDIWISNATSPKLVYRMNNSNFSLPVLNLYNTWTGQNVFDTTSSVGTPVIRVTQRGSGHAIVVEDEVNPDTSAFVVNASGAIGVGVDPSTWNPGTVQGTAVKVDVSGHLKTTTMSNGTGPKVSINALQAHSGGSDTHELIISVNGSTFRVGMKFVSTP
jgi:hypothetical protein